MPALLTDTVHDLFSQIHKCSRFYHAFQIDIADGQFVPNTTVTLDEILAYLEAENSAHIYHSCVFDLHLMVNDYETELDKVAALQSFIPIQTVYIHLGTNPPYKKLKRRYPMISIGLVLNPEDTVTQLIEHTPLSSIDSIQIMSVNPGFQEASFIPDVLNKIDQLKNKNYKSQIALDGGINKKTLPVILDRDHRPDILGIGSYISKAEDIEKRVEEINRLIEKDD